MGFGAHPALGVSFLSTYCVPGPMLKHQGHRAYETDVVSVLEGLEDKRETGPDTGTCVTAMGPRPRRVCEGASGRATPAGDEVKT